MIIILPIEIAKLNDVSRNKSTMTDSNHIYLRLSIECIVLSNSITCFYSLVFDICHDFILKALYMLTLQARFQHTNKINVSFVSTLGPHATKHNSWNITWFVSH